MSVEKMINDAALETIAGGTVRTAKGKGLGYAVVRNEPGLSGKIIGKINNGTKVNATGRRSLRDGYWWIEITFEGGKGWVANAQLGY